MVTSPDIGLKNVFSSVFSKDVFTGVPISDSQPSGPSVPPPSGFLCCC